MITMNCLHDTNPIYSKYTERHYTVKPVECVVGDSNSATEQSYALQNTLLIITTSPTACRSVLHLF